MSPEHLPTTSEDRAEFLAKISHEIRTPLNAILGYAEMLEKTPLDDKQRQYAGHITKSGLALVDILNVWLKQAREPDAVPAAPAAPAASAPAVPEESAPFTMLVVEDSELIRDLFTDIFTGENYRILTTGSGREALGLAERETPDLIFLDLHLPDADGRQVAEQLRGSAVTGQIPLVVMTGEVLQPEAYKAQFDEFLQKPFQLKTLRALVEARRAAAASRRAAAAATEIASPGAAQPAFAANLAETVRPHWNEELTRLLKAALHTGGLPHCAELGDLLARTGEERRCPAMREAGEGLGAGAAEPDIAGVEALIQALRPLLEDTP